jgi:hypothetical protein
VPGAATLGGVRVFGTHLEGARGGGSPERSGAERWATRGQARRACGGDGGAGPMRHAHTHIADANRPH